jgi:rare lipoprotein A
MRRPADEAIFEEASLTTPAAIPPPEPKPLVPPPEAVSVSTLAPLPAARTSRDVPKDAPKDAQRAVQHDASREAYDAAVPVHSASRDVFGPVARPVSAQSDRAQVYGTQSYRIQAGAFGDEEHARRAVAQLATTGTATIEPIERNGSTLYRVVIPGPSDEAEAFAMRDKVAGIGLADARVLRP